MVESILGLKLQDVREYNPNEFVRVRVFYKGAALPEERMWFITPAQAVILSDLEQRIGGRQLTLAEEIIMKECPEELYTRGGDSIMLQVPATHKHVNAVSQASVYDLIK